MSIGEYLLCGGARLPRETLQDCERFKLAWFKSHSLFWFFPRPHSCSGPHIRAQELLGQPFLGDRGMQQVCDSQDRFLQEFMLFLWQVPGNMQRIKQHWYLFYSELRLGNPTNCCLE